MKPEAALSARSHVDRLRASIVQDRLLGREICGARKMREFDRSIPRDEVIQRRVDEREVLPALDPPEPDPPNLARTASHAVVSSGEGGPFPRAQQATLTRTIYERSLSSTRLRLHVSTGRRLTRGIDVAAELRARRQ